MRKLLLLLLALICGVGAGYAAARFIQPKPKPVAVNRPAMPAGAAALQGEALNRNSGGARSSDVVPLNPVFKEPLRVRGYIARGKRVNVYLSDGTVLTERDRELESVERNSVTILGKKYALAGPDTGAAAKPRSVPVPSSIQSGLVSEPEAKTSPSEDQPGPYAVGADGVARIKETRAAPVVSDGQRQRVPEIR